VAESRETTKHECEEEEGNQPPLWGCQ
jgi:hypothetical protein